MSTQPPRRRLNRRYVTYVLVGILVVATMTSIPFLVSSTYNHADDIANYWQSRGFFIATPFNRTTLYGVDAYAGNVIKNQTNLNTNLTIAPYITIEVFPRSSESDAHSFEQTLVNQFESQGFVEMNRTTDSWAGVSTNFSVVGIKAYSHYNPTDSSAVEVYVTNVAQATSYVNQITSYYEAEGYTILNPFQRTNLYGADAYAGGIIKNQTIMNVDIFPRSSESDAHSFEQTLVNQFESQGFVEMNRTTDTWSGISNTSSVFIESSGHLSATNSSAVSVITEAKQTMMMLSGPAASVQLPAFSARNATVLRPESSAEACLLVGPFSLGA